MSKSLHLQRALAGIAVASLAIGALAACGSSGSGAAPSSPAGGSSSSVAAPTGSVIKIAVIGSNSGDQASSSSQGATVGPAWADYVNKELGGINGHPVQIVNVDDKGDPVTAQAAGKELAGSGVQAVVVASDNLLQAFEDSLIQAKIPVLGGAANIPDWYTKVGLFPTIIDPSINAAASVILIKQFSKATKMADIYCSEVAACAQGAELTKEPALKAGIGFTQLAASSSATSYTALCLSLRQQKVDFVQLDIASSASVKFITDCQAQGYNPTWGTSQQSLTPEMVKLPNTTLLGPAFGFPQAADSPLVKTYTDAMKTYAKDDNWLGGTSAYTWIALEVVRKALAGTDANTPVTAATVMSGLYTLKDENLGGLMANKITFTEGKPVGFGTNRCTFTLGAENGKETAPNGMTPTCVPAS